MGYDRRTILRLLGAGLGVSTTGGVASGTNLRPPMVPASTLSGQSGESPASRIAARTERIMDELGWFATAYDDALETHHEACESVQTAVSDHGESIELTEQDIRRLDRELDRPSFDRGWPYDIWWDENERLWRYVPIDWQRPSDDAERPPLSASAIDDLRTETNAFVDTFEAEFESHFYGIGQERQFATDTIATIERFNDRGDAAMVVAGLLRLYRHYETLQSVDYAETYLSDSPIQNRLVDDLESPVAEAGSTPPLFEIDYRKDGGEQDTHVAFAYSDDVDSGRMNSLYRAEPALTIDGSTWDRTELALETVVGALEVRQNRLDRAYVVVNEWTDPSSGYYSATLPSQPIFVQRYETEDAAAAAKQRLLERDGIARAAGVDVHLADVENLVDWVPIYFPYEYAPWNAALMQAGRHVLVAGVARRPFEHRSWEVLGTEWSSPLELSWIWTRPTRVE